MAGEYNSSWICRSWNTGAAQRDTVWRRARAGTGGGVRGRPAAGLTASDPHGVGAVVPACWGGQGGREG